jgi:hypothetical protein
VPGSLRKALTQGIRFIGFGLVSYPLGLLITAGLHEGMGLAAEASTVLALPRGWVPGRSALHLLFLALLFVLSHRLARSLAGSWVALLVVGLLAFHPVFSWQAAAFNNAMLAARVVLTVNVAAIRYFEAPD